MANELQMMEEKDFSFDASDTAQSVALKVKDSKEIQVIAKELNIKNADSIMTFGAATAQDISQFADRILASMKNTNIEDSGALLIQLNKIMEKFDAKDFEEKKKDGFLDKIFSSAKQSIEGLLRKYESMGSEVDKVYQQLKTYEREINTSNQVLEEMFEKNMVYYETLQKYIYGGKLALEQIKSNELLQLEAKISDDLEDAQLNQMALNNMHQAIEMVEQRIFDLELAQNVALQSLPQIKLIQRGNYNLMRKINSAFIVTLPIFKQSLTHAIALKRQGVQAKAMAALDEKTNELLLKNAQNTALQSKLTAQMASGSSIDVNTLQETWRIIVDGIEETRRIQNEAKEKRVEGVKQLQEIQNEFQSKTKMV
jgi:uncharacterized protein YaaN involved in tellurite resistance